MLHRVVTPFPCSWDGITSVDLEIGDERDFGSMADGLVAIGWIEAIEARAPAATEPRVSVAAVQPHEEPAPARRKRK